MIIDERKKQSSIVNTEAGQTAVGDADNDGRSPMLHRREPIVITVAVTKGGVAKTTTAVNLAAEMGMHGARTLLVDMDEQGNSTLSATGKNREAFNNAALFDAYRTFGFT